MTNREETMSTDETDDSLQDISQKHCASGNGPDNDQVENNGTLTECESYFPGMVKNNHINDTHTFDKFSEHTDMLEKDQAEECALSPATDSVLTQTCGTVEQSIELAEKSQAISAVSADFSKPSYNPVFCGKAEFQQKRIVAEQESRETGRDPLDEKVISDVPVTQNGDDITDHDLSYADVITEDYAETDGIDFGTTLFDDKIESIECDMCFVEGKVVIPTSYCYVCQIYLCESCYRFHSKISGTCDHSVIHRNDLIKNVFKQSTTYGSEKNSGDDSSRSVQVKRHLVDPGRNKPECTEEEETLCAPCKVEGRKETGKCKNYHAKFEVTKDHEVVHKQSMSEKDFQTFVPAVTNSYSSGGHAFGSTSSIKSDIPSDSHTLKLKNPKTFSALTYCDLQTPQITGLAFMSDGNLLVCDSRNKNLKLFSNKLSPLSSLNAPGIADVTALNDNTAVITQPEKSIMFYVGIKANSKMFVRKSVETKGSYWGVDSLHGELFALCMADFGSQATIHMLGINGQILSVIHPHLGQGYDLQLQNSKYFTVSPAGGTFYISDTLLGLVAIGTDGRAIFSCQSPDIERPCGVKADTKNIYVCCPTTGSLVKVSPDGKHFTELVTFDKDMALPSCIALAPDEEHIAVGMLEGETINMYKKK